VSVWARQNVERNFITTTNYNQLHLFFEIFNFFFLVETDIKDQFGRLTFWFNCLENVNNISRYTKT